MSFHHWMGLRVIFYAPRNCVWLNDMYNRDLLLNSQSLLKKNCELNCEFANSQFKIANSQFKIANWPKTLRIKLRICELDSQFGGRFRLRMVKPHTFMVWGFSFERFLRFVDFVQFISELTPFSNNRICIEWFVRLVQINKFERNFVLC